MSRGIAGPFRSERFVGDTTISTKPSWLGTYTAVNSGAVAITLTFYDDAAGGTNLPIEQAIIMVGQTLAIYPNGDTLNGLGIKASSWASMTVFVRWAPR